jgi:hypothetical protein
MDTPDTLDTASRGKGLKVSGYPDSGSGARIVDQNQPKPAKKPMRETMPQVTEWVDEWRAVFGAEEINASIRAGLAGQPTFWACENGVEVGTKDTRTGIPLSDIVIEAPGATVQAGKGKKC